MYSDLFLLIGLLLEYRLIFLLDPQDDLALWKPSGTMNEISSLSLPIMNYVVANEIISQRVRDGYINATALCKASGKLFSGYTRLKTTQDFLAALSSDMQIHISDLVQSIKGGPPHLQGTWVHPQVALSTLPSGSLRSLLYKSQGGYLIGCLER